MSDHSHDADSPALRAEALESLLHEKGFLDPSVVDTIVERYEKDIGPLRGAQVVARAWSDQDYKRRLLANGTAAVGEMGFEGAQMQHLEVKENRR